MNRELKMMAINMVKQEGRLISEVAKEMSVSNRKLFRWLQESANQSLFKSESETAVFDSNYVYALG